MTRDEAVRQYLIDGASIVSGTEIIDGPMGKGFVAGWNARDEEVNNLKNLLSEGVDRLRWYDAEYETPFYGKAALALKQKTGD